MSESHSNVAIVVALTNVRPHPGADRLKLATVFGFQIIVGLEAKDGDLGIFFNDNLQLSQEFCIANDLFPRFDEQGRRIGGGFFDPKNRRVRAQKFRGEKSDGFWCPIGYLNGMFFHEVVDNLKEGDQFTVLADRVVCNKYETEATKKAAASGQKAGTSKKNFFFREHVDTKQFAYEASKIPVGSVVHLSEKLHGTSARYGFFAEKVEFTGWKKHFFAFIYFLCGFLKVKNVNFTSRNLLVGSRRVQLKSIVSDTSFYGDEGFRFAVAEKLKDNIRLGETVYGELVGYSKDSTLIMGKVSNDAVADKEFSKQWGSHTEYKYGCPVGTSRFFVYRITQTNEDGHVVELSVPQMKARCKVLGFDYVPEFSGPLVVVPDSQGLNRMGLVHPLVIGNDPGVFQGLEKLVESFLDGPSTLDPTHIREGVVVRVDTPNGDTYFLKSKAWAFKVLEGILKDKADYIDTEESA